MVANMEGDPEARTAERVQKFLVVFVQLLQRERELLADLLSDTSFEQNQLKFIPTFNQ